MPSWFTQVDHLCRSLRFERLFLGRHKFYHFRIWYKRQLKNYLEASRGFQPSCYRTGTSERLVQEHVAGRNNHTLELHQLLSMQLIERLLL